MYSGVQYKELLLRQSKYKTVIKENLPWCSLGDTIILRVGVITKASNLRK